MDRNLLLGFAEVCGGDAEEGTDCSVSHAQCHDNHNAEEDVDPNVVRSAFAIGDPPGSAETDSDGYEKRFYPLNNMFINHKFLLY